MLNAVATPRPPSTATAGNLPTPQVAQLHSLPGDSRQQAFQGVGYPQPTRPKLPGKIANSSTRSSIRKSPMAQPHGLPSIAQTTLGLLIHDHRPERRRTSTGAIQTHKPDQNTHTTTPKQPTETTQNHPPNPPNQHQPPIPPPSRPALLLPLPKHHLQTPLAQHPKAQTRRISAHARRGAKQPDPDPADRSLRRTVRLRGKGQQAGTRSRPPGRLSGRRGEDRGSRGEDAAGDGGEVWASAWQFAGCAH